MSRVRQCFISAGERSGDLIGADLVHKMNLLISGLQLTGIAGKLMEAAGVKPIFPLEKLNVMGLVDVAKQAPELRMLERDVMTHVDRSPPDVAVLIDYPGFHFRLAEQFHLRGIPVIQYVAPKVWAWGASRVARLKRDFDLVLGILPFEEEFFRKNGVPWQYVGCPVLNRLQEIEVSRSQLGLPTDKKLLACLPGSRMTEVRRILPVIGILKTCISARLPDVEFIIPVAGSLDYDAVAGMLPEAQRSGIHFVREMSLEAMWVADAAIVASGTATLECALLETPMVVIYVLDELSFHLAKRKFQVAWVSLVNLCLGRESVREYIQDIDYDSVTSEIIDLLESSAARAKQLKDFRELRRLLGPATASEVAARMIAPYLNSD